MKKLGAVTWAVLTSLSLTGASLAWVGIGVVRQSARVTIRNDFGYQRMLAAVDELTALHGNAQALRATVVDTVLHGRRIEFDTLVITADAALIPSLGPGGFLYDEVGRYNAFQRERAAIAIVDYDQFERLRPYNPSIFRPYRRGDGSLGVTRTAAAWNRRVQSPFNDDWSGELRANDVVKGWGLLSPYASLSFESPRPIRRSVHGRDQLCEFETDEADAFAYCLSEARRPQAVFRGARGGHGEPQVLAGWNPLRLDGDRIAPGDSVKLRAGSIVRIAPLEPVVFGQYWEGVLSSPQWVNGRMRRRGSARPPLDLLSAAGQQPIDPENPPESDASLPLSIDVERTAQLTDELEEFVRGLPLGIEFGAVVIARVPDGAILVLAETGERSEPGRSRLLERVAPGSVVKPLLAAAILSERPDLASLEIPARSGRVTRILNAPAIPGRRAFTSTLNCRGATPSLIDLREYLRCSNNEYAASLMLAGLSTRESGRPGRTVSRTALLRSPLSSGVSNLFGLTTDPLIADSLGRSDEVWAQLRFSDGAPTYVPYEARPDASRPALLASGADESTDLSLLYRYAYGAWENRWNLFDLTAGFARVVSDRRVRVGFAPRDSLRAPSSVLGLSEHDWYAELLRGLAAVAEDGTGRGLADRWRSLGLPRTVYAKTGTLAEAEARGGRGLFVKSLVFAVGASAGVGSPLECGVVGSVYLSFSEGPSSGALPGYQLEYARTRLGRFLRTNWRHFDVCPDDPPGTG